MKTVKNISWVDRHAEFIQTDLYKNYHASLLLEREQILMVGKRTHDPHILSKLDGFDQAASFFQRCHDTLVSSNKTETEEDNDPQF